MHGNLGAPEMTVPAMTMTHLLEGEADFAPSQLEGPCSSLWEDSSPRNHGHNDGATDEVANVAHNPALGQLLQGCLPLKVLQRGKHCFVTMCYTLVRVAWHLRVHGPHHHCTQHVTVRCLTSL